ncbi:MAG: response regulator [Selenomonadaceae bacterium]|nr:response regulator [Selenomonadaceae bacterium]
MRKKKILVIDDDEMNLQIAKMVLEKKLTCEVFCVDTGEAGLDVLRSERVDLVLLDILMPEHDGIETLADIRGDVLTKDVPVIMLTASGAAENIQRVSELGVQDYIKKPFMPADLVARVKKKLDELRPEEVLLIGEDYASLLELQKLIEETFPYETQIATSVETAEKFLSERNIRLIIANAEMKFVSGYEFLAMIAANEKFCAIPFTLTTDKKLFAHLSKIRQPPPVEEEPPHASKKKLANVVTSAIGYELDVRI